ncbi:MAG: Eco57I restriction-modification methylase domain-containing protein [bacterium]
MKYLQKKSTLKNWKDKEAKPIRDFVKKLMGRLVFLQFLQKKEWMGVPANTKGWTGGDKGFLKSFFVGFEDKIHFNSLGLKILFFDTLNKKRENDIAPSILDKNIKIPYLNGGLFDKDPNYEYEVDFTPTLFLDLLDFFEQYNFTIDENDPYDSEVGIDPEMLGHIFENLLEENREKGAFYTPKEIVKYMCQESLIEYLFTNLPDEKREDIINLVRLHKISDSFYVFDNAKKINKLLKDVKICDPAIGSGAFPMGMLKEIFGCRKILYGFLNDNHSFDPALVKKEIIQKNIYGVDIEIGAVEIARLRFWLSLVVDEIEPQPLPNLDYKIMQGNSLLERFGDIDLKDLINVEDDIIIKDVEHDVLSPEFEPEPIQLTIFDKTTKEYLSELIQKYYDPDDWKNNTGETIDKYSVKKEINDIINGKLKAQLFFEKEKIQKEINLFNARYCIKNDDDVKRLKQNNKEVVRYLKLKDNLLKLKDDEIVLKEMQKKEERPYFLWHLWFKDVFDKGGFDIIIGNPPYIKEYTDKSAFDGLHNSPYYEGKMDIWYLFACFGIDILKNKGVECFIAQNNWTTSYGASKLRNKILNETEILLFTDFGNYKVFESAGIQTMINLLKKKNPRNSYPLIYGRLNNDSADQRVLISFLNTQNLESNSEFRRYIFNFQPPIYKNEFITFNESKVQQIIDEIKKNDLTFLFAEEIAQGIVAPQDKLNKQNQKILGDLYKIGDGIFQLTKLEKENLNLTNEENSIIKPFYSSNQLKRYFADKITDEYLIYLKSGANQIIDLYPNIKKHLIQFTSIITSDNKPFGLHRAREEKFFKGEKIFSLRKCEKPTFTYCNFDCYVSQSYFIIKTNRLSLKYLTLLLNSRLITFWLLNKGKRQGNNFQIDKEPLLNIPVRKIDNTNLFEVMCDYLIFLYDKTKPKVNEYLDNTSIARFFEKVADMMVYELYFEEHMRDLEIDVLEYFNTKKILLDINNFKNEPVYQAGIINNVFTILQEQANPVRNRVILANIRSQDIIAQINGSTI